MHNDFLIIDDNFKKLRNLYLKCNTLLLINKFIEENIENEIKEENIENEIKEEKIENEIKEEKIENEIKEEKIENEIKEEKIETIKLETIKLDTEKLETIKLEDKIKQNLEKNKINNTVIDICVNGDYDYKSDEEKDIEETEFHDEQYGIGCGLLFEGCDMICGCISHYCKKYCKKIRDYCIKCKERCEKMNKND
jgi:hypothetical protein